MQISWHEKHHIIFEAALSKIMLPANSLFLSRRRFIIFTLHCSTPGIIKTLWGSHMCAYTANWPLFISTWLLLNIMPADKFTIQINFLGAISENQRQTNFLRLLG